MENKKKVSEILKKGDFDKYGTYAIFAGMGSGKSYWAEHIVPTWYDKVYIASSRESKVSQIVNDNNPFNKRVINKYETGNFTNMVNRVRRYGLDYFIKQFECIIIDEVHALFTDSTFSDDCFQIVRLINYIRDNNIKTRLILMTATTNRLKKWFADADIEIKDLTKVCGNKEPRNIIIDTRDGIIREMLQTIEMGRIAALMINEAKDIPDFYIPAFENQGIKRDKILGVMSESRAKDLKYPYPETEYDSIVKTHMLPSNISILLATSKFREGINILNDNIGFVGNESSDSVALQQFLGRYRKYDGNYYIVGDAKGNYVADISDEDYEIAETFCDLFNNKILNKPIEEKAAFIKRYNKSDVHKLITYSIIDDRFMLNTVKYFQIKNAIEENKQHKENLKEYIQSIYPDTPIDFQDKISEIVHDKFKTFSDNEFKIFYDENEDFWELIQSLFDLPKNSPNLIPTINQRMIEYSASHKLNYRFEASKKEAQLKNKGSEKRIKRRYMLIKKVYFDEKSPPMKGSPKYDSQ